MTVKWSLGRLKPIHRLGNGLTPVMSTQQKWKIQNGVLETLFQTAKTIKGRHKDGP